MTSEAEKTAASVEENTAQALKFLAQSDAEFEAGDDRQDAEKLYGAATQVVVAAAKQRGWGYRSHRTNKNAVTRLADQYGDPFLAAGFGMAERFHIHFHHGDMEEYQMEADRPLLREYVQRLVDLVNEYDMNGHNGQRS